MAELGSWDTSAGGNGFTVPDGFPEGMNYSDVNNAAREIMAVLAREYKDRSGELVSTGSSNTYSITSNRTLGAYANGQTFKFRANHTSTGAATINVSSLGPKAISRPDGTAIISGAIQSGGIYDVSYSSALDKFVLFGGFGVDINQVAAATTTAAGKVELGTDAETIAGTDATRVASLAAITALFFASGRKVAATDGYFKLPSGSSNPIIVQWGRTGNLGDIAGGTQTATDNFATSFVSSPYIVIPVFTCLDADIGLSPNIRLYWDQSATTTSTAAFKFSEESGGVQKNLAISYIAVGV